MSKYLTLGIGNLAFHLKRRTSLILVTPLWIALIPSVATASTSAAATGENVDPAICDSALSAGLSLTYSLEASADLSIAVENILRRHVASAKRNVTDAGASFGGAAGSFYRSRSEEYLDELDSSKSSTERQSVARNIALRLLDTSDALSAWVECHRIHFGQTERGLALDITMEDTTTFAFSVGFDPEYELTAYAEYVLVTNADCEAAIAVGDKIPRTGKPVFCTRKDPEQPSHIVVATTQGGRTKRVAPVENTTEAPVVEAVLRAELSLGGNSAVSSVPVLSVAGRLRSEATVRVRVTGYAEVANRDFNDPRTRYGADLGGGVVVKVQFDDATPISIPYSFRIRENNYKLALEHVLVPHDGWRGRVRVELAVSGAAWPSGTMHLLPGLLLTASSVDE